MNKWFYCETWLADIFLFIWLNELLVAFEMKYATIYIIVLSIIIIYHRTSTGFCYVWSLGVSAGWLVHWYTWYLIGWREAITNKLYTNCNLLTRLFMIWFWKTGRDGLVYDSVFFRYQYHCIALQWPCCMIETFKKSFMLKVWRTVKTLITANKSRVRSKQY